MTARFCNPTLRSRPRRQERGIILFVALIVLVAMTLAGLAVVRTTDTGMLIAGNLAFRKNAKMSADIGVEAARQWLLQTLGGNLAALDIDVPPRYKATWTLDTDSAKDRKLMNDPNLWDWTNAGSALAANDEDRSGNLIRYVIHRMCANPGSVKLEECVTNPSGGNPNNIPCEGAGCPPPAISSLLPYYRITARVDGPRGTVTYIQSFVY